MLDLSVKEIEKILYFVKYIVVNVDEKQKKNALGNLDKDYENKLKELDNLYKDEISKLDDNKKDFSKEEFKAKKQELEKLYSENK
ncbi:MAG: hypothetical protein ACOZBL_00230 [Patescibacteria group bacterium]